MFRRCLALLLLWHGVALADVDSDLRESLWAISAAEEASDREPGAPIRLDQPIGVLTRLIDDRETPAAAVTVARYWRARAYSALNFGRQARGEKVDRDLARRNLQDYDQVIARGMEPRGWGMSIGNSIYSAGAVAYNHLEDKALAYRYWERCAALGHAGCLNVMAGARLTGEGGMAVDLEQSMALNKTVYDTGTRFRCAGAFSALMIARIIHFAGLKPQPVDELEWLDRAYPLLAELEKEDKNDNPCGRAVFEINDYLMRLGRGERRPELLRAAAARTAGNDFAPVARYLLGEESRETFEEHVRALPVKHNACTGHFIGAWSASLERDPARAARHVESMVELGVCETSLVLFRLRKNW